MTRRECGDCQLCCKLLPVVPLGKKAGERCKHQKFGKGCKVYHRAGFPMECGIWNCRWLVDQAGATGRPDRVHYVIDVMPDYVTVQENDTGKQHNIQIAQIWIDPDYPDAHRDPALRAWMFERAQEGIACIVRYDSKKALTIFPPPFDVNGEWHERWDGKSVEREQSLTEMALKLGSSVRMVMEP